MTSQTAAQASLDTVIGAMKTGMDRLVCASECAWRKSLHRTDRSMLLRLGNGPVRSLLMVKEAAYIGARLEQADARVEYVSEQTL